MPLPQENGRYTYADYCSWDDGARWELIDGVPYAMSPAPTTRHQRILGAFHHILYTFLKGKPCQVFLAPFDVRLDVPDWEDTVVQPDISVICDRSKIDEQGCNGAPDLVIEILSPSTARRDRMVKLRLYQAAGVREYWMVDPETETVQVCILKEGFYIIHIYGDEDKAPVEVLPGCEIDLLEIFPKEEQQDSQQ